MGFVGDTDRSAEDAFFPGWAHLAATVGRERGWATPTRQQFDALVGPLGAFLVGEPSTVVQKIREADQALGGVSRITFQMSTASLDPTAMRRSIELLGLEVAPRVRAAPSASVMTDQLTASP
jgi:alkanesulfonate monooxygenase SsuD/methylene tetrahydromethanopterin reductase-like flavin-dependent oxidoreductase (luciferase family)